jgi:hypothetical protein
VRRWIAVVAGAFGLVAYLRRRRRPEPPEVEPADELRARLAESRAAEAPAAEPGHEPEAADDAVGDRRRDVHDRARQALDELG